MPQPFLLWREYMKTSGIGGQAVIEGIMMRNKDKYAIESLTMKLSFL